MLKKLLYLISSLNKLIKLKNILRFRNSIEKILKKLTLLLIVQNASKQTIRMKKLEKSHANLNHTIVKTIREREHSWRVISDKKGFSCSFEKTIDFTDSLKLLIFFGRMDKNISIWQFCIWYLVWDWLNLIC